MPPDQLLLYAMLMPAAGGIVLLLLPLAPWARDEHDVTQSQRREPWLSGAAFGIAMCASLAVTDGWPWASAWSSWKLLYASAAIIAVAGAFASLRGVPRNETVALAAAAAVLWYRVPEARELPVRMSAAALASLVAFTMCRCARRAPAWCAIVAAAQALALAGLVGSSGSSKVAAAAGAVALTLASGAIATRVSRGFSCGAGAALASGGLGVALALYGRGYHDSIPSWVWWSVAAVPVALCAPWAITPASRRAA